MRLHAHADAVGHRGGGGLGDGRAHAAESGATYRPARRRIEARRGACHRCDAAVSCCWACGVRGIEAVCSSASSIASSHGVRARRVASTDRRRAARPRACAAPAGVTPSSPARRRRRTSARAPIGRRRRAAPRDGRAERPPTTSAQRDASMRTTRAREALRGAAGVVAQARAGRAAVGELAARSRAARSATAAASTARTSPPGPTGDARSRRPSWRCGTTRSRTTRSPTAGSR